MLRGPLAGLAQLAANLRWSWHVETQDLFERIDPALWHAGRRDPLRLLGAVTTGRLDELAQDEDFLSHLAWVSGGLQDYLQGDRWYQTLGSDAPQAIAYFSPEYGISKVLPQYSGGLGILAGDHLKAASDLGVPIVAVGLFYRAGYFRQSLSADGWQLETYPLLDPDALPLALLREEDGTPVVVSVALAGERMVHAHVWRAQVGRVPLLLLDSDVEANGAVERDITDRLYGGGGEHRLAQELLLGIGGVRALRAYSRITGAPAPEVFHTNEGHAGFLGFERIRELVSDEGLSFDEAFRAVRAGTVFTTHTPVPAGIDRFPRELVERYCGGPADAGHHGVPVARVLELGAESYPGGDPDTFNMAVLGLRLGQRSNGVSRLHGKVSRHMFAGVWEGFDPDEVPITSITNGVHAPTWVARELRDLIAARSGPDSIGEPEGWQVAAQLGDKELWDAKRTMREHLVAVVRELVRDSCLARGSSDAEIGWISDIFDPDILTIGFARRVPSYKRLTLMLRDPDRLEALLLDPQRPVQLVVAGKAHPADEGGKELIRTLVQFTDRREVRHRIVFLPDYGMGMARAMYPGCDVWLNNPLRPLEASGTSGMKAALNGALNLSILDGWWDEWYDGQNGWAIPTADRVEDPERRDELEAQALYDLIERRVAPMFYDVDESGLPVHWLDRVRHTLGTLGPKVLASRMVREYVTELYQPATATSRAMLADGAARAKSLAAYVARVRALWPQVSVEHADAEDLKDAPQRGDVCTVRAYVRLGELSPSEVTVQLLVGRVDHNDQLVDAQAMVLEPSEQLDGHRWRYETQVELTHTGPFGYTVRVLPRHGGLVNAAELGLQAVPVA